MRTVLFISWVIFASIYVFFIDLIDSSLHMTFKLIPMLLAIAIALSTRTTERIYYRWIVIGLIFCTIGDYTLQWFLLGLSTFLIGHLFYIRAFTTTSAGTTPKLVKIGLILYGVIMLAWVGGTLVSRGDLVLAVAVTFYITVILTMGWTSFRTGSRLAVIGALLFIVSDSVLAVNRFIADVPLAHEIIMLTYYGAQILFAFSIAYYSEPRNKMLQYRHLN